MDSYNDPSYDYGWDNGYESGYTDAIKDFINLQASIFAIFMSYANNYSESNELYKEIMNALKDRALELQSGGRDG